MNNNVVNAFNHEDRNTWRWNDRLLANTPLEGDEPQRITQVAAGLGLERERIIDLLDTSPNRKVLEILTWGLNNDQQKQIACRAAIIIKAQAKREIHLRGAPNNAVNAHDQMTHLLNVLPSEPARINLIHKAMDSHFAAQAFRRGRATLNDYNYTFDHNNCHPRYEIKKDSLIQFFNRIVEKEDNDQNYIQIGRRHNAQNLAIFIDEAYNYLKEIYNECAIRCYTNNDANNPTQIARNSLDQLIASPEGTDVIRTAIQSDVPSSVLSTSLKSLARIAHTTPVQIAQCIQFAYAMAGVQEGLLDRNTINQILSHPNGAGAILAASKAGLDFAGLSQAIARASNDNSYPLDTVAKKIQYISLASSLIDVPEEVLGRCQSAEIDELLTHEAGISALALARYLFSDEKFNNLEAGKRLSQSLYYAINNNENRPLHNVETRANYLKLILDTFYLRTPYHLNTLLRIKHKSTTIKGMNRCLSDDRLKLSFNRARAANLAARSIANLMSLIDINRAGDNNITELIENINLTLGIIEEGEGPGIQAQEGVVIPINAELVNELMQHDPSVSQILHRARTKHLNSRSIASLMSVANSPSRRLSNVRSAMELLNDREGPSVGWDRLNECLADINNAIILNDIWRQKSHTLPEIKNAIINNTLNTLLVWEGLVTQAERAHLMRDTINLIKKTDPHDERNDNLRFIISILDLRDPHVHADRINELITQNQGKWFSNTKIVDSINNARSKGLEACSVAQLIGDNHPNDNIIKNIKCLTDIIGNDRQIAARLINPYLRLNNAVQNLNAYRGYTENPAALRVMINQDVQMVKIQDLEQQLQALRALQDPIEPAAPVPPLHLAPVN